MARSVNDVLPGSPAEKAGIKSGDVIVAFNDKPVTDAHSLQLDVADCSPGTSATLKVIRNGREKAFAVVVVLAEIHAHDGGASGNQNGTDAGNSQTDSLDGVKVTDLNPDARQQLNIPDNIKGALVTDVDADSNAAKAGLQEDDVIIEINRQPVTDADGAVKFSNDAKGDRILLKIWRRSDDFVGTHFLSVDNTKRQK